MLAFCASLEPWSHARSQNTESKPPLNQQILGVISSQVAGNFMLAFCASLPCGHALWNNIHDDVIDFMPCAACCSEHSPRLEIIHFMPCAACCSDEIIDFMHWAACCSERSSLIENTRIKHHPASSIYTQGGCRGAPLDIACYVRPTWARARGLEDLQQPGLFVLGRLLEGQLLLDSGGERSFSVPPMGDSTRAGCICVGEVEMITLNIIVFKMLFQ